MSNKKNQPKFVVGKKYQYALGSIPYECLGFGDGWIVLKHPKSGPWLTTNLSNLEEAKEPRKLTFYVNIYETKSGNVFTGTTVYNIKAVAETMTWFDAKLIATVPVEWVEKV